MLVSCCKADVIHKQTADTLQYCLKRDSLLTPDVNKTLSFSGQASSTGVPANQESKQS
jgi:hypothetical protein